MTWRLWLACGLMLFFPLVGCGGDPPPPPQEVQDAETVHEPPDVDLGEPEGETGDADAPGAY